MNKDDVEYEEQIPKMALGASQMPKEYVPGGESILAGSSVEERGRVTTD